MANAYVREVLDVKANIGSADVVELLWRIAGERSSGAPLRVGVAAAAAGPPPASPHGERASSLLSVLASFVEQLAEAELSPIASTGREARYRFLDRRFDAGMSKAVRDALQQLLSSARTLDAISVGAAAYWTKPL
eukprot:Hpha_TRINITY_DN8203_c0_g1::TRINITY_DN8203_c0_g1_i1::g.112066::m.112066